MCSHAVDIADARSKIENEKETYSIGWILYISRMRDAIFGDSISLLSQSKNKAKEEENDEEES